MTRRRPQATATHTVLLTRRVTFAASHRLFNPAFSAEKNRQVFGLCANPNGHGHNYALEVTVAGDPEPATGMVMNLRDLKRIIERRILDDCDHRHLNLDVPWLAGINPTAENLALAFWERLADRVKPARLHRIKLFESPDNQVEIVA